QFGGDVAGAAGFAVIRFPDVLLHGLVYVEVRDQFAVGVVGMAVEQPVGVGKQDQHIGMDQFGHQARQLVVVGKRRHRQRHGVVFVSDGDDAFGQQALVAIDHVVAVFT